MTVKELKDRLIVIRDSVLELNPHWIAAVDDGVAKGADTGTLYEAYNCLHGAVTSLPCANPLIALIARGVNCECTDKGCPCDGDCRELATETIFRIDMEDDTGTRMCGTCADGAHLTGLFRSTFGSVELNNAI